MKKIVFASLLSVFVLGIVFNMSSCQKSDVTPPYITFYTGAGYVHDDTALVHGTIFTIYVFAEKAGADQLLTTGRISRSINGGPDSVLQTMNLSTQLFTQYYSYIASDSGKKETYKFTFGQLDGLSDSAKVTITDL